jgi:Ni/Co efflux regulator RcnB
MKRLAVVGGICASFLLGAAMTAVAQDEHRDERKDDKREERHDARQEERHDEMRHDEHAHHIDDEHFRQHFGHEHHFVIRHVNVVEGRPRFGYGGYNFEIAQPWPHGWSYNDNTYIDFIDGGYFLFDERHPGVRIAVTVLP